jgi:hypothetical protein
MVQAVVSISEAKAFIAVDGNTITYRTGQILAPGWTVFAINEAGVMLKGPKAKKFVRVGEEKEL